MEEFPLCRHSPDSIRKRRSGATHSAELFVNTGSAGDVTESLLMRDDDERMLLDSELEENLPPNLEQEYQSVCNSGIEATKIHDVRAASSLGFFDFFWSELARGYSLQNDRSRFTEKRKKVYAFVQVPFELERFLGYGFLQCVDAFCYMFTFLPLRFLIAIWHLLIFPLNRIGPSPSEICDILKVFVVVFSTGLIMQYVDTSSIYHLVRSQSVIKLYIFFNMLEVADKLFSSFGQDILDALFWTATEPKSSRKYLPPHFGTVTHLFIAIVYAFLHTLLVLLQATTLSVAFNSHNKALLTVMMSNNFVELKGSVFKKFAKPNLFQMSCSDVRERFHYVILLSIVALRNMTAVNWKIEHFWEMLPDLMVVFFSELGVDWFKHAFITKFNEIPAQVYRDFKITIAYDVLRSRDEQAFSDHSDQVSRRMGFIPIPLSVLMIRIISQSFSFASKQALCLLVLSWICLVTLKILNSIVLLGKACKYISEYESMQQQAELLQRCRMKKSKSVPASPRMSLVDFSDVMQQPSGSTRVFTVSDLLSHLDELSQQQSQNSPVVEKSPMSAEKLPKRSHSVAYLDRARLARMNLSGDAPLVEVDESVERSTSEPADQTGELSPKRRVKMPSECEKLADVQAYTLLNTNDDRIEP